MMFLMIIDGIAITSGIIINNYELIIPLIDYKL